MSSESMGDLFAKLLDAVAGISYSYYDRDLKPEIEIIEEVEEYIRLLRLVKGIDRRP